MKPRSYLLVMIGMCVNINVHTWNLCGEVALAMICGSDRQVLIDFYCLEHYLDLYFCNKSLQRNFFFFACR